VVHCPGANAFLGDGVARVPEMLERGVRVALGPDGGCANNRQSIFDEMRMASLVAKARLLDGGALDASTAFAMGTSAAADLLGIPAGSFDEGKRADAVAIDLNDISLLPHKVLERNIVNSMQPTAIAKVMVGGEVVVEDGRPTKVPPERIRELVEAATSSWERP
jgi:5-methylthioadenosine/S-adenosylhomocysteine deaminase